MTVVIDTPNGIRAWQAMRLYFALKLEVDNPSMSYSRGSVMNHIKANYLPNCKARTKAKVLAEFEIYLRERGVFK